MLCVRVHGCDPGRVSDGSRLALYSKLSPSIKCPSSIFFWQHVMCFVLCSYLFVVFFFFNALVGGLYYCRCSSEIFSCPADHAPEWQPRILPGMVEARSVNVKLVRSPFLTSHKWRGLLYPPGVWFADVMTSFSGSTFVLLCFVFSLYALVETAALRSIALFELQAPR